MALAVGSRLAHYEVTALIGEGGMGQVYRATDTKLNRQVALKMLVLELVEGPVSFDWFNAQDGRISGALAGERRAVGEDIEQPVNTLLHVSYPLP